MKLKKLWIKKYKNLENFEINFENQVSVFIWKNGSWKTNLLEAIAFIFRDLYEIERQLCEFQYKIEYEIDYKNINVKLTEEEEKWELNKRYEISVDGKKIEDYDFSREPLLLPKNIFIYNSWFWWDYNRSNINFNHNSWLQRPIFLVPDEYYKNVILSLFYSNLDRHREFFRKMNIEGMISFTISYKYRKLTKKNSIIFETFKEFSLNKGVNNILEFDSDIFNDEDFRHFMWHDKDFFKIIYEFTINNIFHNLRINIKLFSWEEISISDISEWQKQLSLTTWIYNFMDDEENLFLFDEPDTFLHPNWQKEFIPDLIKTQSKWDLTDNNWNYITTEKNEKILVNTSIKGHFLITTHSPLLIWSSENIDIFWLEDNDWKSNILCWTNNDVKPRSDRFEKIDIYWNRAEFIYENVFWLESTRASDFEKEIDRLHELLKKNAHTNKQLNKNELSEIKKLREYLISKIWDDIDDLYLAYLTKDQLSEIIKESYKKNNLFLISKFLQILNLIKENYEKNK